MAGHAKNIDTRQAARKGSDYGAIFPAFKDNELRKRVSTAIFTCRSEGEYLDADEVREIAVYISELEDTLLRLAISGVDSSEILKGLQSSTGLDIASQADDMERVLKGHD